MALRVQRERMEGAAAAVAAASTPRATGSPRTRLRRAAPDALVLHPGPMNEGVEIAPDVASGARSVITEQVANGVAVRMAVLYLLAGGRTREASGG